MTARRVLFIALLLAVASVSAFGQFAISPTSFPTTPHLVGQTIPQLQPGITGPFASDAINWSESGNFPPGLTIDPSKGTILGIPTQAGAFTFTVNAVDNQRVPPQQASQQYTLYITLGPLTLTTVTHPQAAVGASYVATPFQAGGGVPNYIWGFQNGTNADGLNLSLSTGRLSGIPVAGGVFPISVVIVDASGAQASASFDLNVLGVGTTSLPGVAVGSSYSQTLAAVGGTGTLSWSVVGRNLPPPGLTLSSQGQITGTATAAGTFPFVVQVTDSATALSATQALSITVTAAALTITPAALPNGFVNLPYPATTLSVQGVEISNWTVTTGTLPAGLNLNASTGAIGGTPTAAGNSTFDISATPASGTAVLPPVVQTFTVAITSATVSGFPAIGVTASQVSATVALTDGTYPLLINGTMTLSFTPLSGAPQNYDAKFGTGTGTTVNFTIPAGTTPGLFGTASSVPLMVGTVAGTITIATAIQDSAGNTLTPPAPIVITVPPTAPVITKSAFNTANGAFSISVTGYSPTRDMTSALFHFTPTTSGPLTTADFTIPLTAPFTTWYNSSAATPFGSQFTMTVPFTFTHPPGATFPCLSVSVTLTNSKGTSTPSGATCQAVTPVP